MNAHAGYAKAIHMGTAIKTYHEDAYCFHVLDDKESFQVSDNQNKRK